MLLPVALIILFFVESLTTELTPEDQLYQPTWESLDTRILPSWYDQAKVGIFIHWGVFSVPSFQSEWFWHSWHQNNPEILSFMKNNYKPNFTYQDFAQSFTAEFFDGKQWATLLNRSGAKYVVLTSKHHEGYTMWPSRFSFSWNSNDVGPKRDLIGEFVYAIRSHSKLHVGLYHSLLEWYNPIYLQDQSNQFASNDFVEHKVLPEMVELVDRYKPDIFWSDGDWTASDSYWKSKEFLVWLYNESPVKDTVVVNDRWGNTTRCKHGGFFTCCDRFNPGNILINIGPTKEGWISPIFQERLIQLGDWLEINGESIYGSSPWSHQNDTMSETWYTTKNNNVYALTLKWPQNNILQLADVGKLFVKNQTKVQLLGYNGNLKWKSLKKWIEITFPDKAKVQNDYVWVVKIH